MDSDLPSLLKIYIHARNSLAATSSVQAATAIAARARHALHTHTALVARSSFLEAAVGLHSAALGSLALATDAVTAQDSADAALCAADLDSAHARAAATLAPLSATPVHPYFSAGPPRTLLDFVDTARTDAIQARAQASLARFEAAAATTATTATGTSSPTPFPDVLATLSLPEPRPDTAGPASSLFRQIEAEATEAGRNLSGLVQHFDRCTAVLTHTDGGGDAIRDCTPTTPSASSGAESMPSAMQAGFIGSRADLLSIRPDDGPENEPDPAGPDGLAQMTATILEDAAMVDGVVDDIDARLGRIHELERALAGLLAAEYGAVRRLQALFHTVQQAGRAGREQAGAVAASHSAWLAERATLSGLMGEYAAVTSFQAGLVDVYDLLLIEAERREKIEDKVRKDVLPVLATVNRLAGLDQARRDRFAHVWADWAGVCERIWPRFADRAVRWTVVPDDEGAEEEADGADGADGGGGADAAAAAAAGQDRAERKRSGRDRATRTMDEVYGLAELPTEAVIQAVARKDRRRAMRRER